MYETTGREALLQPDPSSCPTVVQMLTVRIWMALNAY